MIANMVSNKKNLRTIVTELFIRERKLNIYTTCLTQSYFQVQIFYCENSKQTRALTNRI